MTSWQKVKLGDKDITTLIGDGLHGTPVYSKDGEYAFINGNNLISGYIVIKSDTKMVNLSEYLKYKKDLDYNTLFVSINGTLGNVAEYNNEKIILGKSACYLNISPAVEKKFIKYVLLSPLFQDYLQNNATGTTIKNVSLKQIRDYSFNLPPLDVQKKIAGVLGALDDKIELNNRINNNLEQQAQALFKSWFVDFEPFGGTMPKDWKVGNLLDIADYLNGLAMQKFRPAEKDKGLPVLKIKELRQGFCDSNSELCSLNVKNEYIVNDGDVIFSWSGSLLVDFWCGGKCGLNQHLFKVTSKNFDKWFYFLWTKHYLEHFAFIAADKATTMGHIKREELEKAKVVIPSSECYQKMKQIMTPIYDLLISNRVENTRLSVLRDALLPKLMSGEIDVSNVDISALTSTDKLSFTGV